MVERFDDRAPNHLEPPAQIIPAVIEHVAGETRANDAGENAMFKVRGRELLTCLLADLLMEQRSSSKSKDAS